MANDDNQSVWMYDPSFPLAIVGTVVYSIVFLAIAYLTIIKYRAWYFSVVVIGAAIEVAAYILRTYSVKNQTDLPPFVMTLTFTVLAPVFVAAGNYLLISRLIRAVLPPSNSRVLRIPGQFLTPIFVVCDIVAFMIQGGGSGIASSDNWDGPNGQIGKNVLIGGLAFQVLSFSFFLCVFGRFHFLANRCEVSNAPAGWRRLMLAIYVSSVLSMIRSIYRVCEFAEGIDGYAFRTEWIFWVFEALPMVGAIGAFCIYHPSRYLSGETSTSKDHKSEEVREIPSGSLVGQEVV